MSLQMYKGSPPYLVEERLDKINSLLDRGHSLNTGHIVNKTAAFSADKAT